MGMYSKKACRALAASSRPEGTPAYAAASERFARTWSGYQLLGRLVIVPLHNQGDLSLKPLDIFIIEEVVGEVAAEVVERTGDAAFGGGDDVVPDRAILQGN